MEESEAARRFGLRIAASFIVGRLILTLIDRIFGS